jgi:hypothetical protein
MCASTLANQKGGMNLEIISIETYKNLSVREQIRYFRYLFHEITDVEEFEKIWRRYDPQYKDRRKSA